MSGKLLFVLIVVVFCGLVSTAWAQQNRRVIQLSGIVLGKDDRDSLIQLPGVHVYVPKAGRGAVTNAVGFFSMPVMAGDSVVISSVGYERQWYVVPNHPSEFLTIIVEMVQDITYLQEIEVMPFPTEEVFKEAILALNLPPEKGPIDRKNISQELLALMIRTTPMDGPMNQRYYLDQWAASQGQQYAPITNPYLNVFNWAKFFKSLQQNKKKK
ncbi:MAG: hypothetical protein KatS3mg032_1163 [Cyclobacteriaceae bacterium]|nr:MAG: hypothetical protein KatS3mg032_1163 [Cyclobacteriaceae bacterium]